MTKTLRTKSWIQGMARLGLIAKGIVYVTLGALAFMAAFEIMGQSDQNANRKGVFHFIKEAPAGPWLLGLVAAGLICYSVWRVIQSFSTNETDESKKWKKRTRYLFSGLTYLFIAFSAIKMIFHDNRKGDQNQEMSAQIMDKAYGPWVLGLAALAIAATGLYQAWYGLAGKYKEHVQELDRRKVASAILLRAGKIGYISRGLVWLIVAFLLSRAALHANAKEAGDTGKAFQLIEAGSGSYLLGAVGVGLVAYGVFNFIRARWERL